MAWLLIFKPEEPSEKSIVGTLPDENEGDKYFASDMLMIYPLVRQFAELYFERHRPDDASFVSLARACELAD